MNTKFSILFYFILLFIPVFTMAAKSIKKEETKIMMPTEPVRSKAGLIQAGHLNDDLAIPWHKADFQKNCIPHPDEDGKSHRFHFNRFEKRRCRYFLKLSSRLFLIILHVASLLFGYMQYVH